MDWGQVVGSRVRRLRTSSRLAARRPRGAVLQARSAATDDGTYISRLERGWTTPSLFVYIQVADALEIPAGRLLGEEGLERTLSSDQELLLRLVEHLGLTPEQAAARLCRAA